MKAGDDRISIMRNWKILVLLSVFVVLVYFPAFRFFFAQDDFLFIKHFSQNSLIVDFKNAFGPPEVTHWRPVHNLYFLISGNVFGKNYFGYHLIIFALHILTSFLIYKISLKLFKSPSTAIFASFVYLLHPAHFTALFWISGSAINIGLFFLTLSIYNLLLKRRLIALFLYLVALLASEAIIVGLVMFAGVLAYQKKLKNEFNFILGLLLVTLAFIVARFVLFSPAVTSDVYKLGISNETIFAIKFYFLRTLGFVEGSGKSFISVALFLWLFSTCLIFLKNREDKVNGRGMLFALLIFSVGFFPFVLIPNHLSAHYMSISVLGYSMLLGIFIARTKSHVLILLLFAFLLICFVSVRLNMQNSWVVNRSNLAHQIIKNVEDDGLPAGSTITFGDSIFASSKEKYVSLGSGEAINFWFRDKNYKTCFSFFENCPDNLR